MANKKVSELPASNTLAGAYVLGVDENGVSVKIPIGTLINALLAGKQDTLVSGTNIKTVNNVNILGAGNIPVSGGGGTSNYSELSSKPKINNIELSGNKTSAQLGLQDKLTSGNTIKTVNGESLLGTGNIEIPRGEDGADGHDGADAVNPFKGWYNSTSELPSSPQKGDYAYVIDPDPATTASIYECATAGTWSNSGKTADTSNVQTFNTGEQVNATKIVNDLTTGGEHDVLSAEQGKELDAKIVRHIGFNLYDGNGEVYTSSGVKYKRNCVVPIDSANNSVLTLSCAGTSGNSYFYDTKFILEDNTEIAASYTSQGYSSGNTRCGNRYAIPQNAKMFSFRYRITPVGSSTLDLVREVMASYGNSIAKAYYPYEETNIIANPYFKPYTDEVKMPVYIAPDGNNTTGDGTIENPFFSINKALQQGKDIVARGGMYDITRADISYSIYKRVSITAYHDETPIFFGGRKVATTATLMSGSTKVYEVTASDQNCNWLFQWGVADESTRIPDEERVSYHGNRTHRMPYATAIKLTTSIQSIEDSDDYLFYYDSGARKIYFSCPSAPSASNFIYSPSDNFFSGHAGYELELKGLIFVGMSCNIGPVNETNGGMGCCNSVLEDCAVFGTRQACFNFNNADNTVAIRCEAAYADSGANQNGSDGFNVHSRTDTITNIRLVDCWSHDNGNDGYSDHERCKTIIEGGLFEHNSIFGVGCGLTPAYGACDVIRNVISQCNNSRGIGYFGVQDDTKCGVVCMNCVSRYNTSDGFYLSDSATVELINCASYGNSRGIKGSSSKNIKTIRTSSFGNTNSDQYVDVIDA